MEQLIMEGLNENGVTSMLNLERFWIDIDEAQEFREQKHLLIDVSEFLGYLFPFN